MEQREIIKLLVRDTLVRELTDMQVAKIADKIERSVEFDELIDRICAESEEV